MNYSNIVYFSTVNGKGVRTSLFVSGCDLYCKGCFNKSAWDYGSGNELTDEVLETILSSIDKEYIDGLSILGGEPLATNNLDGVLHVVKEFRKKFGYTKNIWIWSGRELDDILKDEKRKEIVSLCDVIVDGRFVAELADDSLYFRGSSNQIIWENKYDGTFEKSELNKLK